MLTSIETLSWDSEFFGLRVGRARIREDAGSPSLTADLARYDCVYLELDVPLIRHVPAWVALGARPIDIRVELAAEPRAAVSSPSIDAIGEWDDRDRARGSALARQLSTESRFNQDPRFASRVGDLYDRWIGRAFAGEDLTLVWREDGDIVALLTYRADGPSAWLELLAVDPAWQGRGIGTALAIEFLSRARIAGATTGEVRTQLRNIPAIRTYEAAGFRLQSCVLVMHWWSDANRSSV